MDILKQCTFVDRNRNAEIDLDELVEEKYLNGKRIHRENIFYLVLYFNANWLPDSCNRVLNTKLEKFTAHKRLKSKFELIFISSDKTRDSYSQFLNENKFIRYSLAFHEYDLKAQLTKYLNINGIPFLTVIQLKLDHSLKLMDYKIEYTNAKQAILADQTGSNFPWMTSELSSATSDLADMSRKEKESFDSIELKESSDALRLIYKCAKQFTKGNKSLSDMGSDFLFLVLGSNKTKLTFAFVSGLIEFWKEFHVKYKFEVLYFSLEDSIDKSIANLVNNLPWFYFENSNEDLKKKLFEFYSFNNIKSFPKLMIIDSDTGEMLNQSVKLTLLEYVHEFCNRQTEVANAYKRRSLVQELNDLNFDFDVYDICKFVSENQSDRSSRVKRKTLDKELLEQLSNNLNEISNVCSEKVENISQNLFYLIYFCSNFTTSNENIFNNLKHFMTSIQDKFNCCVRIVIVSSDQTREDYIKLLEKIDSKLSNAKKSDEFSRYALNFDAIHVKEMLFRQLKVAGIPWFSLINAKNGEILGDNLRHLILNSQLRGVKI